jgi:hypothetical protein
MAFSALNINIYLDAIGDRHKPDSDHGVMYKVMFLTGTAKEAAEASLPAHVGGVSAAIEAYRTYLAYKAMFLTGTAWQVSEFLPSSFGSYMRLVETTPKMQYIAAYMPRRFPPLMGHIEIGTVRELYEPQELTQLWGG